MVDSPLPMTLPLAGLCEILTTKQRPDALVLRPRRPAKSRPCLWPHPHPTESAKQLVNRTWLQMKQSQIRCLWVGNQDKFTSILLAEHASTPSHKSHLEITHAVIELGQAFRECFTDIHSTSWKKVVGSTKFGLELTTLRVSLPPCHNQRGPNTSFRAHKASEAEMPAAVDVVTAKRPSKLSQSVLNSMGQINKWDDVSRQIEEPDFKVSQWEG